MTGRGLWLLPVAMLAMMTGSCGGSGDAEVAPAPPVPWQKIIRDDDRKRLAGLWGAWTRALNEADKAGERAGLTALGEIVVPDAARPAPLPVPGAYRCRVIKLGSLDDGSKRAPSPPLIVGDFVPCEIADRAGVMRFEIEHGVQRIAGTLYPDGERQIFLGSLGLVGEAGIMDYGADSDRDQLGVLRPIGDRRWRLELPWPKWQSNLVVIEILPA